MRDFLQNKLLGQADTRAQADALLEAGGSSADAKLNPTIRELLDRAALELAPDKIEANFPKQPLLQAELLKTVGRYLPWRGRIRLGDSIPDPRSRAQKTHLGPDHPETLMTLNHLAEAIDSAGKLRQGDRTLRASARRAVEAAGARSPLDTSKRLTVLAIGVPDRPGS